MKPSLSVGISLLGVAMVAAAHAQLMHVTFDTSNIEGDFYEFNAASPDRNELGNPIHHVHPIAGSLHFETTVDLAAAAAAGDPKVFDFRLWGDIDDLGHLDIAPFGLVVNHLGDRTWSLETPFQDQPTGALLFNAQVGLNADLTPMGASIELRVYGDPDYAREIFQNSPGLYLLDTTVWASANADQMTAARVHSPPLTSVPEPATLGWISAFGLCGLIGWRQGVRRIRRSDAVAVV